MADQVKQNEADQPKLRFLHMRASVPLALKAVSVGYFVRQGENDTRFLEGQVAKCCYRDVFCKKIARDIIEGRFKKKGVAFSIEIKNDLFTPYEILIETFHPDYIAERADYIADALPE